MTKRRRFILVGILGLVCLIFYSAPSFGLHSGLGSFFSAEFLHDYTKAEYTATHEPKSVEPLLAMLTKYNRPEEQTELNLTLGLLYNQQTGLVDGAKAVIYFNKALQYDLPERQYLEILMWRGNSLEGTKKYDDA